MTSRNVARWVDRLARRLARAAERFRSSRLSSHPLVIVVAMLLFVGGAAVAYANLPRSQLNVRWPWLLLIAVAGVPATAALNAAEYRFSARILGHRIGPLQALRVSLIATAANQLPLPGSPLVRMQALKQLGTGYRKAAASTLAVGLTWLGTTLVMAGMFLLASNPGLFGAIAVPVGLLLVIVATLMFRRQATVPDLKWAMAELILIEAGSVTVTAARLYLATIAIGFSISFPQALGLAISIVIASSLGFFPGGLGIRELLAAGIAPLIALPASVALLATAVDRLTALAFFAVASLPVLLLRGRSRATDASVRQAMIPTDSPTQAPR